MTADSSLFVFGRYADPAFLATEARDRLAGLFHGARIEPVDPLPDQAVAALVETGAQVGVERVEIRYTVDGSVPGAAAPRLEARGPETRWDDLAWRFVDRWVTSFPPLPEGSRVRYTVEGRLAGGGTIYADGRADRPELFGYDVDRRRAPDWIRDAVIYQIFVDRFFHLGDDAGRPLQHIDEIYGGTLAGIEAKLPYLADLGITVLWITPIFSSETAHGYDAMDFERVAERVGGDAALRSLVGAAHGRGIRVLLDLAPNHVSWHHPFFLDAQRDPQSRYRDWFTFESWPDSYQSFFGTPYLPELNTRNLEVVSYLCEAAARWVRDFGVDGFRLDYALGPPLLFFTELQGALKAVSDDAFTVGEATTSPAGLRAFEGRLDGCLDFPTLQAFREFFVAGSIDALAFHRYLERSMGYFAEGFARPTFLDNHDMNRFLWAAGGDVRKLRLAATCQLTLPQPPIIYYGTEVGLSQEQDVSEGGFGVSRLPMRWGDAQDTSLLEYYRTLIRIRREHASLRRGERESLAAEGGLYVYRCRHGEDRVVVALNNSPSKTQVQLPGAAGTDLLSGSQLEDRLQLEPYGAAIVAV